MKAFTVAATAGMERWQADLAYRNELARTVALNVIEAGGQHAESGIMWLKNFVGYTQMGGAERLLVRKYASFIRRIVGNWRVLGEAEQRAFIERRILPSALHRLLSLQHRTAT
jgi:hypothetical protein